MDKLPDELLLHVLSFLDNDELVKCQQLSRRFLTLCRDNNIWKLECFHASRAEAKRRRQQLDAIDSSHLSTLRSAFSDISSQDFRSAENQQPLSAIGESKRAFANWDPSYDDDSTNFYDEYIHRHAPINIGWLPVHGQVPAEATGVGLLQDDGSSPQHAIASLDDGSVCIWDLKLRSTHHHSSQGQVVGRSSIGLLSGGVPPGQSLDNIRAIMTETGTVESVSIDNHLKRGFFAQNNILVEVDLSTLQVISQETFPFHVTALSQAHQSNLVVGTNWTVHVHDPRNKSKSAMDPSLQCELIGGPSASHATLSQPGPLSILDRLDDDSIWVAGRFTHLLNYDRRFFPKILGTVHSGGRISCISERSHPYIPKSLDLLKNPDVRIDELQAAKAAPGSTILAAGEYKGKGSLEFYGLDPSGSSSCVKDYYRNRQTASSTRLLSVATHGTSTVFSDGDGNLKWVERDGTTTIRTHNINQYVETPSFNQVQSAAQVDEQQPQGDIVQKIIPLGQGGSKRQSVSDRPDVNQSDLLLKTGDGRIGVLGFGYTSMYTREEEGDGEVETTAERERKDAEKQYQETLKRALQRQADEVRFMRGLGMAFSAGQ